MHPILVRIRGKLALLLLLVGAGIAARFLVPRLPKERTVELRLPEPVSITAVDVAWAPVTQDDEAVQGADWRFVTGRAPPVLQTVVRLPDGRYALDVRVERGAEREAFHRVIALGDADRVTVRLR